MLSIWQTCQRPTPRSGQWPPRGAVPFIISRDADFAQLVMGRASGPSVIWVRLGNVRKHVLLNRIHSDWGKILALLDAGERLIEMR